MAVEATAVAGRCPLSRPTSLHWHRERRASVGFLAAALVVAVAAALQRELPHWALLICASILAVAGVVLAGLEQVAARRDDREKLIRQSLNGITKDGRLPLAREVSLEDLGVLRSMVDVPYLERDIQQEATDVLSSGKPLLIVGDGLTGKTRLAAELIRQNYPEREVVIPVSAALFQTFLSSLTRIRHTVVWLDGLDRYLTDSPLDRKCIRDLADGENIVIATMNEQLLGNLQGHGDSPSYRAEVLSIFDIKHLKNRTSENARHSKRIDCAKDASIIEKYGIAGYVGGLPIVWQHLAAARIAKPRAFFVTKTLYNWQETGLSRIHHDQLVSLLNRLQGDNRPPFLSSDILEIVSSFHGPLSMPQVIECASGSYRIPGYVADFLRTERGGIPSLVWDSALEAACVHELPLLGHMALVHHRKSEVAEQAWQLAAQAGDLYSMWNLGIVLEKSQNRRDEGIEWLMKACVAGYVDAYETLALCLIRRGKKEEGVRWLELAASEGRSSAMIHLGNLHEKEDAKDDALSWYRQAAKSGSADAAFKISQLLRRSGERDAADDVLKQSSDTRAIETSVMIGIDAYWRGEIEVARDKFLRAAANKSAFGLRELAFVYLGEGNLRAAADSYKQAVELGDGCAKTGLGFIAMTYLENKSIAERWFRQAAQYGCHWAMYYLGTICQESGDQKMAEFWYRGSSRQGNIEGMFRLGQILENQCEYEAAKRWYKKAGRLGHLVAASSLVEMLNTEEQGQDGEAKQWSNRLDSMVEESRQDLTHELPRPTCD
jgi:TPR repeat protein